MSRNGRDQRKSNAEFRIAARVRSDLPILGVGFGLTRNGDNDCFLSNITSDKHDAMSVCQGQKDLFAPFGHAFDAAGKQPSPSGCLKQPRPGFRGQSLLLLTEMGIRAVYGRMEYADLEERLLALVSQAVGVGFPVQELKELK